MTSEPQNKTALNEGHEQAVTPPNPTVTKAGETWVKAVAASAIPERAWTLSRIDASLGSIA